MSRQATMKRDRQSHCGGCGAEQPFLLLHNIPHRGTYRRLCTDCLLKNLQGLFCPFCLQLFDDARPPPPDQRLMCFGCPSISHLSCAPSPAHSSSSFLCPTCSNPTFSFFNSSPLESGRLINTDSARALVAAARIAAAALTKAAAIARVEAERRAKEAILAKKRAKEALEQLSHLAAEENRNSTGLQNNDNKLKSRGAEANGFKKVSNGVSPRGGGH